MSTTVGDVRTAAPAPEQPPSSEPRWAQREPRRRTALARRLALPSVLVLLAGMGYPLAWQVVNSLREYGLAQQFGRAPAFVGLDNYTALLTDAAFWGVVTRSLGFMAVTAVVTMVLGLLLALLMRAAPGWARLVLQVALLLAWAMPIVAQMTVWGWLIDDRNGVANHVLSLLPGVDMVGHDWLVSPWSFFGVASVIIIWASVPFVALTLYASLTQVSSDVVEAAQIDGADGWQMQRHIVLPIVRPVLVVLFLLQLIWDLRVYAQIELLQGFGARGVRYDLLGTYIYGLGVGQGRFGIAAAAAMVVLVLTAVLSWPYVREMLKEDER